LIPRLLVLLLLLAGPAHAGVAEDVAAGEALLAEGETVQAILKLSLAPRAARSADDRAVEANALAALGRAFRAAGRHAEATAKFEEAFALDKKLGRAAAVAADHLELGTSAWLLGNHKAASKRFEKAFKGYQDADVPLGAADALNNLGLVRRDLYALDGAAKALTGAVTLFGAGGDSGGLGDAHTNLGLVYRDQGAYGAAIEAFRAALNAFTAAGDASGRMAALHNLGNLYAELGDFERAEQLYRQARPLAKGVEQEAAAEQALGALLLAAGQPGEAIERFEAALKGAVVGRRAGLLLNLAAALEQSGDAEAALRAYSDAYVDADTTTGSRASSAAAALGLGRHALKTDPRAAASVLDDAVAHADVAGVLDLQWRTRHARAEAEAAADGDPVPLLREAVTLLEDGRSSLDELDPLTARGFLADRASVYQDLIDALLKAGDGASALLYAERLRVAELDSGGAADPQEREYRALARRESRLKGALAKAEASGDTEATAALNKQLGDARIAFSRYVDQLRTSYADFDRLVRVDPTDLEAWQKELKDDEIVLQPVVLPDRLVVLVFSSGPLIYKEIAVTEEELTQRIGRVLRVMRSRRLSRPERLMEHLDALGSWLWAPIANEVAKAKTVIVVPAGPLRYLPFQLLRHEGEYLLAEHDVVNVTNVGSLKRRDDDTLRFSGEELLAFGNPDGTLPAADSEVDALGRLYPGARIVHQGEGTRAALDSLAPGRSVVHLATHGVLDATAPERSYIVLAKDESSPEGRLGYLDIPGLYTAFQDTSLVVLSACETAVPLAPEGDAVQGGGLEIAGLANQFRRAGVPRLLASLWQVSDESTQALMVGFYEGLGQGRTPPDALAAAQRSLLAKEATAHPFHWAPFVLVGTPR
jgi:CHAT domain-containing protein/Tfp pilus assembly protein PilF